MDEKSGAVIEPARNEVTFVVENDFGPRKQTQLWIAFART